MNRLRDFAPLKVLMKKNILFELNKRRWQQQKHARKNNGKQFRNTLIKTNESGEEYSKEKILHIKILKI